MNRFFRNFVFICFIIYFALYISQASGFYEYKNSRKVSLTNAQIKQFERDIDRGKKIDLKKYIDVNNKGYQNSISKVGLSISSTSEKVICKFIEETFKVLSKAMGE